MPSSSKVGRKPGRSGAETPPDTSREIPDPPPELPEGAVPYWHRIAPMLAEMGRLDPSHLESFRRLCVRYHMIDKAEQHVLKYGTHYSATTDRGAKRILKNPNVDNLRVLDSEVRALEAEFGLTPRSSGKVPRPERNRKSARGMY